MSRYLTLADLLSTRDFVASRVRLEAELLTTKRSRRVRLGNHLHFLFENLATVSWQVQEMCRIENIVRPEAIQSELDAYNPLLPRASELSATLLLEFEDPTERESKVRALVGLHQHLHLRFARCEAAHFRLDDNQFSDERVSSVQFARALLTPSQRLALGNLNDRAVIVCTHPAYPAETTLSPVVRASLVEDLDACAD